MKNILAVLVSGIALAGGSFAQQRAGEAEKTRIAVMEFRIGTTALRMTAEAKRQLQASIASALKGTDRFDVVDVRRTRAATSERQLLVANHKNVPTTAGAGSGTGKTLAANFLVMGMVTEYTARNADGVGQVRIKFEVLEVATGKVKFAGETMHRSEVRIGGVAEMHSRVIKPAIEKMTAAIVEVF